MSAKVSLKYIEEFTQGRNLGYVTLVEEVLLQNRICWTTLDFTMIRWITAATNVGSNSNGNNH